MSFIKKGHCFAFHMVCELKLPLSNFFFKKIWHSVPETICNVEWGGAYCFASLQKCFLLPCQKISRSSVILSFLIQDLCLWTGSLKNTWQVKSVHQPMASAGCLTVSDWQLYRFLSLHTQGVERGGILFQRSDPLGSQDTCFTDVHALQNQLHLLPSGAIVLLQRLPNVFFSYPWHECDLFLKKNSLKFLMLVLSNSAVLLPSEGAQNSIVFSC